jgi:hypothetical protein
MLSLEPLQRLLAGGDPDPVDAPDLESLHDGGNELLLVVHEQQLRLAFLHHGFTLAAG